MQIKITVITLNILDAFIEKRRTILPKTKSN